MSTEKTAADFFASLSAREHEDRKNSGWSKDPLPEKVLPPIPHEQSPSLAMTSEKLGTLIVNLFIFKGRDHTIPELAKHAHVSTKTVLDVLAKGLPEGCTAVTRKRGKERVRVYGPTREHLRLMLGRSE